MRQREGHHEAREPDVKKHYKLPAWKEKTFCKVVISRWAGGGGSWSTSQRSHGSEAATVGSER